MSVNGWLTESPAPTAIKLPALVLLGRISTIRFPDRDSDSRVRRVKVGGRRGVIIARLEGRSL